MSKENTLDDDVTVEMPGFKGKASDKAIKALSGSSGVILLLIALLYGGWWHHTSNEQAQQRIFEALEANTYVLSLPQSEREKLNISMPESLRRKIRHRE